MCKQSELSFYGFEVCGYGNGCGDRCSLVDRGKKKFMKFFRVVFVILNSCFD